MESRCCWFSYKGMHIHLHKFRWVMAGSVLRCVCVCVCYTDSPGKKKKKRKLSEEKPTQGLTRKILHIHDGFTSLLYFILFFEATDPAPIISNSLIRLEISSNHCSKCFSSIKDLYESFMEHSILEFRRILRVIIHNICHLLQRALKRPFNVYLMLLIQYNIKEDVLY